MNTPHFGIMTSISHEWQELQRKPRITNLDHRRAKAKWTTEKKEGSREESANVFLAASEHTVSWTSLITPSELKRITRRRQKTRDLNLLGGREWLRRVNPLFSLQKVSWRLKLRSQEKHFKELFAHAETALRTNRNRNGRPARVGWEQESEQHMVAFQRAPFHAVS